MTGRKKSELLKECVKLLSTPKVEHWYKEHLESTRQVETINILERAVSTGELSLREALSVCLVVGVQWHDKFEGTA